jgi:hypothetical protein
LDASLGHAEEICRRFIESKVSGVFFAPYELMAVQDEANRHLAGLLRHAGIPVILLDRDLQPFPTRSDFDVVGIDNVAGGFRLADHLLRLGCERICFLARPLSAPTVDARIAGAREALVRRRVEPAPDWVRLGDPTDVKFVRSLTAGRPDAFICANDYTAARLLRTLESAGIRVPKDVRVVGFDDVKYATLLSVPLTTIHQPRCQGRAMPAVPSARAPPARLARRCSPPSIPPSAARHGEDHFTRVAGLELGPHFHELGVQAGERIDAVGLERHRVEAVRLGVQAGEFLHWRPRPARAFGRRAQLQFQRHRHGLVEGHSRRCRLEPTDLDAAPVARRNVTERLRRVETLPAMARELCSLGCDFRSIARADVICAKHPFLHRLMPEDFRLTVSTGRTGGANWDRYCPHWPKGRDRRPWGLTAHSTISRVRP